MELNLSHREYEIVTLASQGMTDKEIARELSVAVGTLNTYWMRIRAKLGKRTRGEIVRTILEHEFAARTRRLEQELARHEDMVACLQAIIDDGTCSLLLEENGKIVYATAAMSKVLRQAGPRLAVTKGDDNEWSVEVGSAGRIPLRPAGKDSRFRLAVMA